MPGFMDPGVTIVNTTEISVVYGSGGVKNVTSALEFVDGLISTNSKPNVITGSSSKQKYDRLGGETSYMWQWQQLHVTNITSAPC